MAERPNSPIAGKPQTDEYPLPDTGEDHVVHHVSQRKKRKKGVGGEEMELQLTSMIDVIFQLLIYFVITANFMIDEGTILATLPGNAAPTDEPPPPKQTTLIELKSSDDGITLELRVKGQLIEDATALHAFMLGRVQSGDMAIDDPVEIKPDGPVRWQHVVNVFNACVSAELEEVGFSPS